MSPPMSIQELFELSLISPESHEEAKRKLKFFQKHVFLYFHLSSSPQVTLIYRFATMQWNFYGKRDPQRFKLEDLKSRSLYMRDVLNGRTMRLDFCEEEESGHYGCRFESLEMVLHFIECLATLFDITHVEQVDFDRYDREQLKKLDTMQIFKKTSKSDATQYSQEDRELISFLQPSPARPHQFGSFFNLDQLRFNPFDLLDLLPNLHWSVVQDAGEVLSSNDFSEICEEWELMKNSLPDTVGIKFPSTTKPRRKFRLPTQTQNQKQKQKPLKFGKPGAKDCQHYQRNQNVPKMHFR